MKRISFRAGLVLGMSMALLPVAGAGVSAPAAFAQSAPSSAVIAPVQTLYTALDQIVQSHGSFAERSQIVATAVDKSYDLEAVLKASIGLRYNGLNADEKQKLLAAFKAYTVSRYVSNFKPGADIKFTILPTVTDTAVGGNKLVVTDLGASDGSTPTEISYIMNNASGSWKIVDVLLSDARISQAAAQRSDFSSTLTSGGVSGLISVLERKAQAYAKD
ncbi:ABC transporter substrate-binding protein [Acetobacter fabarum]|uniref:ABC transporter substrate-binding protein n=1 Tax=Acetobacter fabarum TaxID=483199 RepID=UPI0039E8625E